ncbi:MAG: outer membrane protein assembly factor BamD [Desulfobacterales bacterium]|nr:outer membrane protein assembly factor BamD [Desulfobacterales bacterium]
MKKTVLIFMIILSIGLLGCSGKKAEELFETAELEELQKNPEHASELYQELIEKYPKSEYAEKARKRLSALKEKNKP